MPWVAILWNGTESDAVRLTAAITRYCECQQLHRCCPAHELMLSQFVLDHLLFERWLHLRDASPMALVDG